MTNEIEINLKNELLATTNTSFRRLLELGGDAMALYMFYLYTSNWQDNQSPKVVTEYTAKGLGWGEDKVRKNKKILLESGWIEEKVVRTMDNTKIAGHYITVKYRVSTLGVSQRVDNQESCFSDPNTPIINKIHHKDKEIHTRSKFSKPLVENISMYINEIGAEVDAEMFFDYYESNGWKVSGRPMVDWKAAVRNWNRRNLSKKKEKISVIYRNQVSSDHSWMLENYEYVDKEMVELRGEDWLAERKKQCEDYILKQTGKKLIW